MAIGYGDTSEARTREVYQSDVKNTAITSPATGAALGTPVVVTYVLESDLDTAAAIIEMSYTINDGDDWTACTADTGHASHDGVTNLSATPTGTSHTYVWDAVADLGASYSDDVALRLRSQDGTYYAEYVEGPTVGVNLVPVVTITAPGSGMYGEPIDVEYSISSLLTGLTFSITSDYSVNSGTDWFTCTAKTTDPDHDGISGLSSGSNTFVWDSLADLGASYSGSTVMVRVRGHNGTTYGSYTSSTTFTVSMAPSVSITSPTASGSQGSPVIVGYTISTFRSINSFSISADYSTNSGSTWNTCNEDTTSTSNDGTTGLTAGAHEFAWGSASDLTTAFQSSTIQVRVRAYDATNYSGYATSQTFEVDMLPGTPVLIAPVDSFFDIGDGAEFTWTIPADPGAETIHFNFQIVNKYSSVSVIDHDTEDEYTRFRHEIDTVTGLKNGGNGISYTVRGLAATSITGTAVTFAELSDYFKEETLPTTLTNPKLMLVNRAEKKAYIPAASITGTGFTIYKSSFGTSGDGEVDLLIYDGAAVSYETYWKTMTITGDTTLTYGTAPMDTDDLGRTIPASITDCRPEILEGGDQPVYLHSSSNTGCVIKKSGFGVGIDPQITLLLRETPTESYQHQGLEVVGDADTGFSASLTDSTNGGTAWPSYIPGAIVSTAARSSRDAWMSVVAGDGVVISESTYGEDVTVEVDIHCTGEQDSSVPYMTNVSPNGVPDTYEGEVARYKVTTADDLADGTYTWQVRAGNETG